MRSNGLLWVGLLVAAVLVVMLGWQNRSLRTQNQALIERLAYPYDGMWVASTPLQDLQGHSLTLGAPPQGRTQVLYFFTPECPCCRASVLAVRELAVRLSQAG